MGTTILGVEHADLVNKLVGVLVSEPDPVKQQVAIELLTEWHALRMRDKKMSLHVAASMCKHVHQLIEQAYR
jgi:hypothetical protein